MIDMLAQSPALFIGTVFVLALLLGSFLNVVIYRLPLMMERDWREQCVELAAQPASDIPQGRFNLLVPPSRCSACGKKISALQNVPVLSYLFLGGKCGHCKKSYSARYPIVEGLTAVMAGIVAWHFGFGWEGIMGIVLTLFLVPITMIDFDHQLIPDSIVLPLLWIGLAMSLWHPMPGADTLFISSHDAIVGAIVGYLTLWSFYWLFKLVTGKEGMGYGDFKLLAALGAWLGVHYLFTIVIMSAVVGATLGIALIVFRGRDRQVPMPFGPFLAVAGWIVMLWGDELKALLHIPF